MSNRTLGVKARGPRSESFLQACPPDSMTSPCLWADTHPRLTNW